jgi:hypothetical protein
MSIDKQHEFNTVKTQSIDLGEDKSCPAWDVNAHVITATRIAFGVSLMKILRVNTIKTAKFRCIRVENDFICAGNFNA